MYDFHYIFIKKNFDAELLFTDTNSLTYEIKPEYVYEEFLSGKIYLTLVIVQKIQGFLMRLIKKVIGKMKDEFGGVTIIEFVGLKSKMYSIKKLMIKIDDKRYVLDDGIHTLSYFHKNSVKSCNN